MSWYEPEQRDKGFDFFLCDSSGKRCSEDSDRLMRDVNTIYFAGSAWSYTMICGTLREVMGHGGKILAYNGNDEIFRLSDADCHSTDCTVSQQAMLRGKIVLSFGWNSAGMGLKHGFEIEEVLLCCHGAAHNDTICLAERRKVDRQKLLF